MKQGWEIKKLGEVRDMINEFAFKSQLLGGGLVSVYTNHVSRCAKFNFIFQYALLSDCRMREYFSYFCEIH